jgi:hypothetical protein
MTMNTAKPEEADSETRAERRALHRALLEISGRLSDGIRKLDCTVLDLSLGGAMVKINSSAFGETGAAEDMGETLVLTLEFTVPALLPAAAVWRAGSVLGLKFLQDPEEVANSLQNLLSMESFKSLAGRDISVLLA